MKKSLLATIIIVIGMIMMVYAGFNYITTEKVVDLGPIKISAEKNHPVHWSPVVGVVLIIGGIVILAVDRLSRNK